MSRALLLLGLTSCASSIDPGKGDDTGSQTVVQPGEAVVDAASESNWVYLDLGTASMVDEPADPLDSPDWDLGFRRYKVMINGGVSGSGGMQVVPLFGADYNDAIEIPSDGWVTDEADADGDGDLEYALDSWFAYDDTSHEVTAADVVYVVQSVETDLYKLQFLAYYDDAGTPAQIHLRWGPLDDTVVVDTGDTGDTGDEGINCTEDTSYLTTTTDDATGITTTQASTGSEDWWVCFDMGSDAQVTEGWDLAMLKWTFVTTAEVATLPGEDFDTLTQAPVDGYLTDDGTGSVFEDWYDYDATEHTLDPADIIYVVHPADAGYYKLQFLSYYQDGDTDQANHPSFRWAEITAPTR